MTGETILRGVVIETGKEEKFKLKNIPDFICTYGYFSDLEILDSQGNMIANTFGVFLNRILPEIREMIIDDLIAMQTGEVEPSEDYVIL